MQRGRRRADGVEDGGDDGGRESAEVRWRFSHCSSAPLVDRLGVSVGEGVGGAANLVLRAPAPHPLFILALCSGGPPTIKGWAPPIRARIKGLIGRWAY